MKMPEEGMLLMNKWWWKDKQKLMSVVLTCHYGPELGQNQASYGLWWHTDWKCINRSSLSDVYMHQWIGSVLVQIMAWRRPGVKPLSEPKMTYCQLDHSKHISMKFYFKFNYFLSRKCIWKYHFVQGSEIFHTLEIIWSICDNQSHVA